MEEILKSIGWKDLYPETLNRMLYFRDAFREVFTHIEISDEELDKCVAYDFGIYGQEHVYNIYSKTVQGVNDKTLADVFTEFINTINETLGEETVYLLTPKSYIYLFLEYCFSLVIKNK